MSANPSLSLRFESLLLAAVVSLTLITTPQVPARASDTVTRWDSFSESSTCGDPYTRTPYVSRSGWLSDAERILGPFGTYFGRSIAEVRSDLLWWTVPGSGGQRVQVNKLMIPDLTRVADSLAAEAKKGRVYRISSVHAFTPRTIGGSHQLSRHALGLAIDINPAQNPYRSDNKLITDMPGWFVDAWREAGFCWGGDWKYSKDSMHFSWIGPGSAASAAGPIMPRAPVTTKTALGNQAQYWTEFAHVMSRYVLNVTDATGNGAPDVVGLRSHSDGSVIDIASSTYGYGRCSIGRWFVEDDSLSDADHVLFGDFDGDSGQDLIVLEKDGGSVVAKVGSRRDEFKNPAAQTTSFDAGSTAFAAGDFDGDGRADVWEATAHGRLKVWAGPQFDVLLHDSVLPGGAPRSMAVGDRDGGDTPEAFLVYGAGNASKVDVLNSRSSWSVDESISLPEPPDQVAALGAGDYDGDGRSDLQVLDTSGSLDVYIGNTGTGRPLSAWFLNPDWECDDSPILLSYKGTFFDDDGSIFEGNIESIAAVGVTRGCNPPFKDRFCPSAEVTRETMAAFLVRALGLKENNHPGFVDVPSGSLFAEDIGRLATAGVTRGCNPPDNDKFCPQDFVTRETMAAFIVRALGLNQNSHPGFLDVAQTSIFAVDIGRLATAGITRGCNPPNNDMFCPKERVTRETMAAFLDRAGLGQ